MEKTNKILDLIMDEVTDGIKNKTNTIRVSEVDVTGRDARDMSFFRNGVLKANKDRVYLVIQETAPIDQ